MESYWQENVEILLPYAKISANKELLGSSMRILGLPANEVDKFWLAKKTVYVSDTSNPHRHLGLRNCLGCGGVLTVVIGGKCTAAGHKATVKAAALLAKQQKEQIELKKKVARKVFCDRCGSFAKLVPGSSVPNIKGLSDADVIAKELVWRATKYCAFSLRCIQIENGLCDVCSGLAGRRCPGCSCWDGPYVLHGCKKHRNTIPIVPRDGRTCAGCVLDQSKYSSNSQKKRTNSRSAGWVSGLCSFICSFNLTMILIITVHLVLFVHLSIPVPLIVHHRLKRKMPEWKSQALEEAFNEIRLKRMRKEGVTRALEEVQGKYNFLYPIVELQCLYKNCTSRIEYMVGNKWMRLYKNLTLKMFLLSLKSIVRRCYFFHISLLNPSLYRRPSQTKL